MCLASVYINTREKSVNSLIALQVLPCVMIKSLGGYYLYVIFKSLVVREPISYVTDVLWYWSRGKMMGSTASFYWVHRNPSEHRSWMFNEKQL